MNNQVTHSELLVRRLQHVLTSSVLLDLGGKLIFDVFFRYNVSVLLRLLLKAFFSSQRRHGFKKV